MSDLKHRIATLEQDCRRWRRLALGSHSWAYDCGAHTAAYMELVRLRKELEGE